MSHKNSLKCALVMPAYNEQECIESVVRAWIKELDRLFKNEFIAIIVNDGSKDKTGMILDQMSKSETRLRVIHQPNGGHGVALLRGYYEATTAGAGYTFHVDSDDQFHTTDFLKLWERRNSSKFITGFRRVRHDAFHRLIITRILKIVVFSVFGVWIDDANVPYRLIQTSYLKRLLSVLPANIFAPNIFLAVIAAKDGQNLGCIPVAHEDRKTGTVSIVRWKLIQVCIRSTRELIHFRFSLNQKISLIRGEAV